MIDHLDKPVYFKLSCIALKYKSRIGDKGAAEYRVHSIGMIRIRISDARSLRS